MVGKKVAIGDVSGCRVFQSKMNVNSVKKTRIFCIKKEKENIIQIPMQVFRIFFKITSSMCNFKKI